MDVKHKLKFSVNVRLARSVGMSPLLYAKGQLVLTKCALMQASHNHFALYVTHNKKRNRVGREKERRRDTERERGRGDNGRKERERKAYGSTKVEWGG